jgi:eukaryotic-like serine/threonine-protein kinase
MLWLSYVALEPFVRRRWPRVLVSWNRMLAGRLRDPMVGRDVLIGMLAGVIIAAIESLRNPLAIVFGSLSPPPLPLSAVAPPLFALSSPRLLVGSVIAIPVISLEIALIALCLVFVLRIVLRSGAVAVAVTGMACAVYYLDTEPAAVSIVCAGVAATVSLFVLLRVGLLAGAVMMTCVNMIQVVPLTSDLSVWYADASVIALLGFIVVAALAFRTALAGRPPISARLLDN